MLEKRADAEERKRLFYVATTRAADYLILSSSLAGYEPNDLESDWMKLLAERFDLATGTRRGELPADYPPPRILVTDNDPSTDFRPIGSGRGPDLVSIVEQARDLAASGGGIAAPDANPIPADPTARRQFSVSRLSGKLVRPDARETDFRPQTSPDAIDPRDLGIFVHAALQRIDLGGQQLVGPFCERLTAESVLHHAERTAELATEMLERFARSPRWAAIAAAKSVHRELEFLLAWPPDGTGTDGDGDGDGRYLQGFFDCLYQDAQGGWHLVDYKTNDVTAGEVASEADRYELQMLVYAMALERALGVPPVELALHFLRPGVEHIFKWNDAARKRCVQLVDDALNSLVAEATSP
jgi:ATP-dependent helicase/nuclease subunit A